MFILKDKNYLDIDRFACEISTTLNLGGHAWPIFLEPDETKGSDDGTKYISDNTKGVKVDLTPGDMLIYKGNLLEHWREPLEGDKCTQVFYTITKQIKMNHLMMAEIFWVYQVVSY